MDERIYRLVMSRPIPERLISDLARAPLLPLWACRRQVNHTLTPALRETLPYVCHGYTNREIAERLQYSEDAIKDRVKRLLAIFRARSRAHLAALAVAQGYVDLDNAQPDQDRR